ncbi:MAG: glutaredoxin 3 [Pseudomonadota bacterium]
MSVTIYTRPLCGYCAAALDLLKSKGTAFHEIDRANRPEIKAEMVQKSGGRMTFPQVFIADRHIGGYDDLARLERSGELDTLLAQG